MSFSEKLLLLHDKLSNIFCGKKVVFHHVPKCGGTSVNRALRMQYFLSQTSLDAISTNKTINLLYPDASDRIFFQKRRDLRQTILLYNLNRYVNWISGHICFSETAYKNFCNTYKFITVLREPITRYISNYNALYANAHTQLSLEDYIETYEGQMQGCVLGEYFSGMQSDADFRSKDAIKKAKHNLEKFDLIGFTDEMSTFGSNAKKLLGVHMHIGHENRAKKIINKPHENVKDSTLERIKSLCVSDVEIYNHAHKELRNNKK